MLVWSLAALGLAVLAVADRDRASRGAAGLVLAALGALSLHVGAGSLDPGRLARIAMTAAVPPWFLEVCLALVVLGSLVAAAATRSWLVGAAALAVATSLRLPIAGTSVARAGTALLLLGLMVGGMALVARGLRGHLRTAADLEREARPAGWRFRALLAAGFFALVSPGPWLAGAAAAAAFLGAPWLPLQRSPRVLAGISALLVLGAVVLMAAAGSGPAGTGTQGTASVAGRQAVVVAGLLLVPSAAALGAWPCHRLWPGAALAPAALALVGRFGLETAPLGLAWWLPAVFPVAIAGVLRGLLASQAVAAAGSLAWVGLWIGTRVSLAGAVILAATALAAMLVPRLAEWRRGAGLRILWASGGAGGVLVLWGGLTAQVAYSALLALLAAAALLQPRGVAASPGRA